MKKKFIIISFLLLLTSCGYKPIYSNQNINNLTFSKIEFKGDNSINRKLKNLLPIKEIENTDNENEIYITSKYNTTTASKNSKGEISSYTSTLSINLSTLKNNNISKKEFNQNFTYNTRSNNYDLKEYQNIIKNELIDKIANEVILFLNLYDS